MSVTSTLVYKEVVYYRFPFPTNGLTFVLEISVGSVICYASNSLQNPGRKYGYIWRVEADSYNDSYIDPSTIQGTVGAYIYIGIDGRSINSNNTFVLTTTGGDASTKGWDIFYLSGLYFSLWFVLELYLSLYSSQPTDQPTDNWKHCYFNQRNVASSSRSHCHSNQRYSTLQAEGLRVSVQLGHHLREYIAALLCVHEP